MESNIQSDKNIKLPATDLRNQIYELMEGVNLKAKSRQNQQDAGFCFNRFLSLNNVPFRSIYQIWVDNLKNGSLKYPLKNHEYPLNAPLHI